MTHLAIPHAIAFFGAGRDAAPHERLETIVSFNDRSEWPKALIAGYEPSAGNEYLFAALDCAIVELHDRSERDKIIIACSVGQPVWSGREGRDWDLSIVRVIQAEQKGLKVSRTDKRSVCLSGLVRSEPPQGAGRAGRDVSRSNVDRSGSGNA